MLTGKERLQNVTVSGLSDDIAVDWVSNKLYWVDAAWARIEVLDLDSLIRVELLRVGPNTNPRGIAVEPTTK